MIAPNSSADDEGPERQSQRDGGFNEMIVEIAQDDVGYDVAEHESDSQPAQADDEEVADCWTV